MAGRLFVAALVASSLLVSGVSAAQYAIIFTEVFSGPGPRHTNDTASAIGSSFAFNNDLKTGGFYGTVIGFVNGFCIVGAETSETAGIPETYYECLQTAVFTEGEYAGSSLTQSAFVKFSEPVPLAIVGGTGQFLGASGALYQSADPTDANTASTDLFVFETTDTHPPPPGTVYPVGSPNCDPKVPNPCYSASGSMFTCCPGNCGPSGVLPACA